MAYGLHVAAESLCGLNSNKKLPFLSVPSRPTYTNVDGPTTGRPSNRLVDDPCREKAADIDRTVRAGVQTRRQLRHTRAITIIPLPNTRPRAVHVVITS